MAQERIDPVYKYVDSQVNKLKKELNEEIEHLRLELLKTQRFVAYDKVYSVANDCRNKVLTEKPKAPSSFYEQLTGKLALAVKELQTSENPLSLAANFQEWCVDEQKKLGITFIDVPD